MNKVMRNGLIGVGVAAVVSGGLSFVAAAGGAADGPQPLLIGGVLGAAIFYLLNNVAGNRKTTRADDETRKRALMFAAPGDRAMLYLVRTGFVAKAAGLDLKVDGGIVAQLKSPQFTCIDLAPGQHEISAALSGGAGAQSAPATRTMTLPAGSVTVLHFAMRMGLVKGHVEIAQWTPDDARAKLQSVAMVLPDTSPL